MERTYLQTTHGAFTLLQDKPGEEGPGTRLKLCADVSDSEGNKSYIVLQMTVPEFARIVRMFFWHAMERKPNIVQFIHRLFVKRWSVMTSPAWKVPDSPMRDWAFRSPTQLD